MGGGGVGPVGAALGFTLVDVPADAPGAVADETTGVVEGTTTEDGVSVAATVVSTEAAAAAAAFASWTVVAAV